MVVEGKVGHVVPYANGFVHVLAANLVVKEKEAEVEGYVDHISLAVVVRHADYMT